MDQPTEHSGVIFEPEATNNRVHTVSTKLNAQELENFNQLAQERSISPGELLRFLFREELSRTRQPSTPSPELVEIVGLRLLLVNLVKPLYTAEEVPLESVDRISGSAKAMKKELAVAILSGEKD